jgi:hypothetical protein
LIGLTDKRILPIDDSDLGIVSAKLPNMGVVIEDRLIVSGIDSNPELPRMLGAQRLDGGCRNQHVASTKTVSQENLPNALGSVLRGLLGSSWGVLSFPPSYPFALRLGILQEDAGAFQQSGFP